MRECVVVRKLLILRDPDPSAWCVYAMAACLKGCLQHCSGCLYGYLSQLYAPRKVNTPLSAAESRKAASSSDVVFDWGETTHLCVCWSPASAARMHALQCVATTQLGRRGAGDERAMRCLDKGARIKSRRYCLLSRKLLATGRYCKPSIFVTFDSAISFLNARFLLFLKPSKLCAFILIFSNPRPYSFVKLVTLWQTYL